MLLLLAGRSWEAGTATGGQQQVGVVSPEAGAPFPWEAEMQVSTYSSVNLFNGNLLTRIPIVGWEALGPDMDFALYHNSAAVDGGIEAPPGAGFSLGAGWSMGYCGQVLHDEENDLAHVIRDDGLVTTYTLVSGQWTAPTGVYDALEESGSGWLLTDKHGWHTEYGANGILKTYCDANLQDFSAGYGPGLCISTNHENTPHGKITNLYDAEGREIWFKYNLPSYVDIMWGEHDAWTLWFTGGRLSSIVFHDDDSGRIDFTYYTDGRIESITDKEGRTFTYEYDQYGRLEAVIDPDMGNLVQSFAYAWLPTNNRFRTTYTDRKENDWQFLFADWGGLLRITNPLLEKRNFDYDSLRNRDYFKNELDQAWSADYDTSGNLLWIIDPLVTNGHLITTHITISRRLRRR